MAKYTKVPSQAASGKDTFNDNLVGHQITDGSAQLTNTSFDIDRAIPQKDAKNFITQPFSKFLTLNDLEIQDSTTTSPTTSKTQPEEKIKFRDSKLDGSKSLFGALNDRIRVSLINIIIKFIFAFISEKIALFWYR